MKVMVIVKSSRECEAGVLPSEQVVAEMRKFNQELIQAGVLRCIEGLQPSSKGKRVRFSGTALTVIDGPFAETKELIGGFWIWEVGSIDEALAWVKRCPNPNGGDCEIEIRPVYAPEDFVLSKAMDESPAEAALPRQQLANSSIL